ncbi:hypothetical protein [Micromonospora sp. 4G55]|nr:hypothetical protein [Micromonospora sp. 4G55]
MFRTKALAHSFRAEQVRAANWGSPSSGCPVYEARTRNLTT